MRTFKSEHFPPLPIESDAGYWSGDIELGGATLPMTLYIDAAITDPQLQEAARLLKDLAELRRQGRAAIAERADSDESIRRDFFEFHLEEVPDSLPATVRANPSNAAFVAALELCGVAIHAATDIGFQLVVDFSFGREHSDQLLAVKFAPDGSIRSLSHES